MEVYAGFLSQTDDEVGRLLRGLRDEGKADNTLVLYVVGDNGGSAEGGLEGSDANLATMGGAKSDLADMLQPSSTTSAAPTTTTITPPAGPGPPARRSSG